MNNSVDKGRRELQLAMVEALENSGFRAGIILPTGTGKAWVLIECLKRINPKGRVWYLCNSEELRDKTFKDELIKWGAEKYIEKIEFMCYQSAYRLEDEEVELCLADEADYVAGQLSKSMTNNKFKHIVLVSATLSAEKRKLIEGIVPIVSEIGLQDIENQGLLNKSRYYEVNYLLTPTESKKYCSYSRTFSRLLNDGKSNHKALEMLKIQRRHFLGSLKSSEVICKKLLKELYKEEQARIVIFCNLSSQADKVCRYSYHSKSVNNMLKEFDEGSIRTLSVVGKIDRGVNIGSGGISSPINRLIFESPTKSSTKFLQRSGRGRRLQAHEVLDVYFLIPHFKNNLGKLLPTIVKKWIRQSTASIDYKPINYKFK